jgi:AraC-like DNA-binding protein
MSGHDYLALQLLRLKPHEEWLNSGNSFSFLFPKGGVGTFVSAGVSHPLAPGDVLVFKEAQDGRVCAADPQELVFGCFSLCLEHLYPLFGSNELSLLQNVTECFKAPRLYPASSLLAQECHQLLAAAPPQHQLDHRGQLLRVVTAILAVEFKEARSARGGFGGAGDNMIQVFEELLVTDIMGLSVTELAERFHCTSRHLNRLFHQHFGFSVAALRMEMRLIKAITLLRNRDAKLTEVAEQCGFTHQGLFNACFKRRFGASPGQWRDANVPAHANPAGLIEGGYLCRKLGNGVCPWASRASSPEPPAPEPVRLSPSRLPNARSSLGSRAPRGRDASAEAAVLAKLRAVSSPTSGKGNGS